MEAIHYTSCDARVKRLHWSTNARSSASTKHTPPRHAIDFVLCFYVVVRNAARESTVVSVRQQQLVQYEVEDTFDSFSYIAQLSAVRMRAKR